MLLFSYNIVWFHKHTIIIVPLVDTTIDRKSGSVLTINAHTCNKRMLAEAEKVYQQSFLLYSERQKQLEQRRRQSKNNTLGQKWRRLKSNELQKSAVKVEQLRMMYEHILANRGLEAFIGSCVIEKRDITPQGCLQSAVKCCAEEIQAGMFKIKPS